MAAQFASRALKYPYLLPLATEIRTPRLLSCAACPAPALECVKPACLNIYIYTCVFINIYIVECVRELSAQVYYLLIIPSDDNDITMV